MAPEIAEAGQAVVAQDSTAATAVVAQVQRLLPLRPLEKTVAMINMDMIGRNPDRAVQVLGTQTSARAGKRNGDSGCCGSTH